MLWPEITAVVIHHQQLSHLGTILLKCTLTERDIIVFIFRCPGGTEIKWVYASSIQSTQTLVQHNMILPNYYLIQSNISMNTEFKMSAKGVVKVIGRLSVILYSNYYWSNIHET